MITWADVVAIAPELASVGVTSQNAILADVALRLNAARWGTRYDMASKYMAAHLGTLTLRGGNGPSGNVVGESVGSVSRQYESSSPMGTDPLWDKTTYGRQYRQLLRELVDRIGLVC